MTRPGSSKWLVISCQLFLWCSATAVAAAGEAGKAIFVHGTVTVERPQSVDLKKGDAVAEGDVVVTAERSRAQLIMKDGAKLALKPGTRLVIDEYFEVGDEVPAPGGAVVVADKGSSVTTLIKGGFRTITGAIAEAEPEAYEARTPVATLGIRGTDFTVIYCNAVSSPCTTPSGGKGPADGLYVGVASGTVEMNNSAGGLVLDAGQYGAVESEDTPPKRLPGPPPAVYANEAVGGEEAEEESEEEEQAAAEETAGEEATTEGEALASGDTEATTSTEAQEEGAVAATESSTGADQTADTGGEATASEEAVVVGPTSASSTQQPASGPEAVASGESAASTEQAASGEQAVASEEGAATTEQATSEGEAVASEESADSSQQAQEEGAVATTESPTDSGQAADGGEPTAASGETDVTIAVTPISPGSVPAPIPAPITVTTVAVQTASVEVGSPDTEVAVSEPPVIEVVAEDETGNPVDLDSGTPTDPVSGSPVSTNFRNVTFATGPLLQSPGFTAVTSNLPGGFVLGPAGAALVAFRGPSPGNPATRGTNYGIGTATNRNVGFDPISGMRWGRWSTGSATLVLPNATSSSLPLNNQSLHWAIGPLSSAPPVIPQTGSATYDLIAGNTDPTDNLGNVGVLGSAQLLADFTNQTVIADVLVSISGSIWSGNGSSALNGHLFGGVFSTVLINNSPGAAGRFSGFFSGLNQTAGGAPTGAGLSYEMESFDGNVVTGVVVFGPLQP